MTADTSWYGQQTLVHPDYSHQPYQAYGDPYADQYGAAAAAPAASGYGWPDHYPQQHEPTLVAEYVGYADHAAYHQGSAHQGYDTSYAGYPAHGAAQGPQGGYSAYPDHSGYSDHAYYPGPDYSVYDTVTDISFMTATEPTWDATTVEALVEFDAVDPVPSEADVTDSADEDHRADAAHESDAPRALREPDDYVARGSRRRAARRRSAVLTIAVPSVAVLGVAGAAAATIGPLRDHHHTTTASADTTAQAKAQALAAAEARDAAERAARDQARTALQLREAAARKTAAEAPRYNLPIAYHTGLSALFGQAGTHWMQLHTGIDFPVPVGTPVHAVTGGTVTTEWNPFYGYMVKLTAPDGTVTWYCHLSSYRVRSGHVKVGDIIAYSGDTGNSTGPHLHFEVHPDGGPAVDPLPWLLARGLDPR